MSFLNFLAGQAGVHFGAGGTWRRSRIHASRTSSSMNSCHRACLPTPRALQGFSRPLYLLRESIPERLPSDTSLLPNPKGYITHHFPSHPTWKQPTMSELAFCKSFLSALDARPVKLSSDHIADARQYPAQGAVSLSHHFTSRIKLQLTSVPSTHFPASHTLPTPRDQTQSPPAHRAMPLHRPRSAYPSNP